MGKAIAVQVKRPQPDLMRVEDMRAMLAQCQDIPTAKDAGNRAESLRRYMKKAGYGLAMQNVGAEVNLWSQRRVGELVASVPRQPGKRTDTSVQSETRLQGLGIDKTQLLRSRRLAKLPEAVFRGTIDTIKGAEQELTVAALLATWPCRMRRAFSRSSAMRCVSHRRIPLP